MATWTITAHADDGTQQVTYSNIHTGSVDVDCGRSEHAISQDAVLAWVVSEAAPMDVVVLDTGRVLAVFARAQE